MSVGDGGGGGGWAYSNNDYVERGSTPYLSTE